MTATQLKLMPEPSSADDNRRALLALETRVRTIEQTLASHTGNTSAKWDAQDNHNAQVNGELRSLRAHMDAKFAQVFAKLGEINLRLVAFASAASAGGAAAAKYLLP